MKRDMSNQENLREAVMEDTTPKINAPEIDEKPPVDVPQQALDDTRRVKVLSPGRLVLKRFLRSKLAIAGTVILILMFSFAFLGGLLSPYRQEEVFHKYDDMELDYAQASFRTDFNATKLSDVTVPTKINASVNTLIKSFAEGETVKYLTDDNQNEYALEKLGAGAFVLEKSVFSEVAHYSTLGSVFTYVNQADQSEAFETFVRGAVAGKPSNVTMFSEDFGGKTYKFIRVAKTFNILVKGEPVVASFYTNLVFDAYKIGETFESDFRFAAIESMYGDGTFDYAEKSYTVEAIEGYANTYTVYEIDGEDKIPFANITNFVARRYSGEDSLSVSYKLRLQRFVTEMNAESKLSGEFSYFEEDGVEVFPEEDAEVNNKNIFKVEKKLESFVVRNERSTYLIDIFGKPSGKHLLGTDANGMDVLTRMMYGGRISLLIGFIVIFLELAIGVVMGGIAGYFGKWVDNIIMRIVDIFNCIPFLPVMIIIGSVFDKLQVDSYDRIMYLMLLLGVLGWPGVARLVRGQILSLREQEFMIAAEATGLTAKRRIFRHLVPNVMPQLIVTATMGLGSIIITESTLSFLGLGAKYPLATWGAMINSVSDAASLVNYTYIWVPVGLLICLTVIAFNFVGDGLRDAFDPKMKR